MGKVKYSGPRARSSAIVDKFTTSFLSVAIIMFFRTIIYQKDCLKQIVMTIVNANYNG